MILKNTQKDQIKQYFANQPNVVAVYLYGSQQNNSMIDEESDVDLAVLLDAEVNLSKKMIDYQIQFTAELQEILHTDNDVDVKILSLNLGYEFCHQVLSTGEVIVDNLPKKRVSFEARADLMYLDFKPVLDQYYNSVLSRIRGENYAN